MTETVDRRTLPLKCRRKQRLSEIEAVHLAQQLAMSGDKMNAYRCPYCDGWHVGHTLGGRFHIDPDIPESVTAARAERAKLGTEILSLQHALARIDEDRSQQGWWAQRERLKAEYNVKRERSSFLRAWILQNDTGPRVRSPAPRSSEDREQKIGPDAARFYTEMLRVLKEAGTSKEFQKVFSKAFACALGDVDGAGDDIEERQRRFRAMLGKWAHEREQSAA